MTYPQFKETYSLFSLSEVLANAGSKRKVKRLLETFKCTRNCDLQDFLHHKAMTFEHHLRSRTYLYLDNVTKEVAAYFTVTISTLHTENVSAKIIKLLDGYQDDVESIPCFLIGQLGKSDQCESIKIGTHILYDATDVIDQAQQMLGGRFILLDAINIKEVIKFYEENVFIPIEEDETQESVKMIKPYFELEADS